MANTTADTASSDASPARMRPATSFTMVRFMAFAPCRGPPGSRLCRAAGGAPLRGRGRSPRRQRGSRFGGESCLEPQVFGEVGTHQAAERDGAQPLELLVVA